jgi:cytochrome c-type biogenesis protein CcmH/NrfG
MDITENKTAGLEEKTESYEFLQELGDYYTTISEYANAQHCYDKAASLEPDEPAPYIGIGVIELQKEQLDEAEAAFNVAARLGPDCPRAYAGLAMVAQQKQHYKQAFDLYLKCLELDTDNLTALLGLFQTSCQMGSFEKVIHYLQVYLDMHPDDTSVMFTLAALHMKDDRLKQSKKILSKLINLEPENKDAINLLEEIEHNLKKKNMKTIKA